jgi:hypothetical protein
MPHIKYEIVQKLELCSAHVRTQVGETIRLMGLLD